MPQEIPYRRCARKKGKLTQQLKVEAIERTGLMWFSRKIIKRRGAADGPTPKLKRTNK